MTSKMQWQPMKTAPRDGTDFLAVDEVPLPDFYIVHFDNEAQAFVLSNDPADTEGKFHGIYTHWMPLPPFEEDMG